MNRVFKCAMLAGVALTLFAGQILALSHQEAAAIAQRVIALNDGEATRSFNTLNERGIFRVTETSGDVAREIAFRVLELNDPALNQHFNLLRSKAVFEVSGGSSLTAAERQALEDVRASLSRCQVEMDRINPLVDEYNASWIPGRLRIRKQISTVIEQARAYLTRAQRGMTGFANHAAPDVQAVRDQVERTRREFSEYIDWWNREFANS